MKEDLTTVELQWAYEKWCSGYSQLEIAYTLHISLSKLKRIFKKHKFKKEKPPLIPPKR